MIKRIAPIALVLMLGAVVAGCSANHAGNSATATASGTATSSTTSSAAATGAAPWYAPYVDASLTMPKFPSHQVLLSFITANDCTPTWNRTPLAQASAINTRIQHTQARGDQVIASFGGKSGPEPAVSCSDPTKLAAAYQTVISRYHLSTIDLDIEGSASLAASVNARRAAAIATVQKAQANNGRRLAVWLTLAVTPSGLLPDSLAVVQQMIAAGVTISGVNVMTLDYGPLGGQTLLSASEHALTSTAAQLQSLGLNSWSALGATIMEGHTDTPGQVWNLADAQALRNFAYTHRLARLSEWSLLRDQQCSGTTPQPSNACSGVTQQLQQFSTILGNQATP
jgi:chitinase